MKAVIVAADRAEHQQVWGGAFAEGLRRHGWEAVVQRSPAPADLLVLWGVRNQPAIAAATGEVCILERGYLGDRFAWTSVSFGGELNGRATFRGPFEDRGRWDRHFASLMKPWSQRAGYALLLGQVPGDMSLRPVGGRLDGWYRTTAAKLQRLGYGVRFRPHPLAYRRGGSSMVIGARTIGGSLDEALAGAAFAVSFNSNSAVDAVLAGVPTIAVDEGSMAWAVTGHEIAPPPMPDRADWAARLAWCQWSREEMASGDCWAAVGAPYLAAAA